MYIYKHTYGFQYLNTVREPTGNILYIVSIFRRARWILRIHHKMHRMFLFSEEPFQLRFPSRHLHGNLLCSAHRSGCLNFSIFVLYFFSMSVFVQLYDLYVMSRKKTYNLFAKFLMINSYVIAKYIVNVTYMVNDNQLGCFVSEKQTRKITAEFHKVTLIKLFIDCLITWSLYIDFK